MTRDRRFLLASGTTAPSRPTAMEPLELNSDGSLVMLEKGCRFVGVDDACIPT